jgi:hypothetical protein
MNTDFSFDDDKLELGPFAQRLEAYLMVEHDFVDGSLVIALDAPFGAGKSTLLSMWKRDLETRRDQKTDLPVVISLNSWEDDFCGDPLLSIAAGFVKSLPQKDSNAKGLGEKIREAVKDIAWYGTALANNAVANLAGIDVMAAGDVAMAKKEERVAKPPDFVKLYENRTAALHELRQALESAFGDNRPKAIVLVDELDRCRPDFAIQYLETIKHVFNVHGLAFILAVDYEQLACSAKALFGEGLNVPGYFRRFFHRRVGLPQLREKGISKLVQSYVGRYLAVEGKRVPFVEAQWTVQHISQLVGVLKLNPREIQELLRTIGHVSAVTDPKKAGKLFWGLAALTVLLAALRVANSPMYGRLCIEQPSLHEVGEFFVSLVGKSEAKWWFCLFFLAAPEGDENTVSKAAAVMKQFAWISEATEEAARNQLRGFGEAFSRYSQNRLKQVYDLLEDLASFESPIDQ